ncbi:arsenate reductase (glutaredoxin) [Roseicella aerolata]|uniref:Arsenate reductase n=1 Tax=Roseicella aerolata TaxID=2883479 RepID=A0A9X1LDC2_9PROT|nr:arsenate reductase (glutaredoxin) [Roseicella aerolata]MCB4824587.1 arsenate reductase (glutaredoxin) [Roseicella aerolata]
MSDVTIWHNPSCGTSRKVLAMIRAAGVEPRIVEYLRTPPDRAALAATIAAAGLTPRQVLRAKEARHAELGLGDPALPQDALLEAMLAHPILIERPFVIAPGGTRLCRPAERVREILPGA